MAKALWFLTKPALAMLGVLTAVYGVLVGLSLATRGNEFIFTYVQGFFIVFDIIIGICAAQAISAYAPLALSFGVTRRSLRGAVAGFWVLLPVLCMVLDYLCNSVTARLFYRDMNKLFVSLTEYPLQGLGFKLLLCGSMLWMGSLEFSALPIWKRVLTIVLVCVIYLQLTVFMLLGTFRPGVLTLYSVVLGVLSLPFILVALHRLQKLAVTQA